MVRLGRVRLVGERTEEGDLRSQWDERLSGELKVYRRAVSFGERYYSISQDHQSAFLTRGRRRSAPVPRRNTVKWFTSFARSIWKTKLVPASSTCCKFVCLREVQHSYPRRGEELTHDVQQRYIQTFSVRRVQVTASFVMLSF